MRSEPQSRQRVMQVSIPSAGRSGCLRKPGDQLMVGFLLLFGERNRNSHATSRFHTFYRTVYPDGAIEMQVGGKARANPKRIDGFDEHAVGAYVASAGLQHRRAPFDIEVEPAIVPRCPASVHATGRIVVVAHLAGDSLCWGFSAAAQGRSRGVCKVRIRSLEPRR